MDSLMKSGGRKRKTDTELVSTQLPICILHNDKSTCEHFTFMSQVKNPTERLKYLLDIRDLRLSQPSDSKYRLEAICNQLPTCLKAEHGYHRDCYQNFTKNVNRLKKVESVGRSSEEPNHKHRRLSSDRVTLFSKDCIFCNKEGPVGFKRSGVWTTEGTQKFQSDSWKTVLECAELKQDELLLIRIRGYDLFASEAHFHPNCRKKYLSEHSKDERTRDSQSVLYQQKLEDTHNLAFSDVCNRVTKEIINEENVICLSDLVKTYVKALENTEFANPNYRGEKLKTKLESRFKGQLAFCKLDAKGKFESQLVYNAKVKIESAIKNAYICGSKNILTEAALSLRQLILNAFEKADQLRWPPIVELISTAENVIPRDLEEFLKFVFSGKGESTSAQTHRLVCSIGQDICRAVTNGEWKLPKHILIATTLRHLYRSKQLTTLLNKLGHSENHVFGIELETAIANALEESSSLLTTQIVRDPNVPSIFHSEFDNFDQLVNTLRGTNSVHTAHGIMMQELNIEDIEDPGGTKPIVPEVPRTKELSITVPVQEELPDCYLMQRKSPQISVKYKTYPGNESVVESCTEQDTIWIFIRNETSPDGQEVPGWTGFVSFTGKKPQRLTTIDYYPVINYPITDFRTVQDCLRYAEDATREVGQLYTVTTFDLGVCMKAYPLIWNNPTRYKRQIILIGTFHLICAYFKMVGKKMAGSGLSDIMLEAGLIGSGSLQGVLTGKNYERALHCHKVVLESLERLLIEQFLRENNCKRALNGLQESSEEKLHNLIQNPSNESLKEVLEDGHINCNLKCTLSSKEGFVMVH